MTGTSITKISCYLTAILNQYFNTLYLERNVEDVSEVFTMFMKTFPVFNYQTP
jgi:hypothetical protein